MSHTRFPITDTHIHLWDPKKFTYDWLEGLPDLNKPFLLEDYKEACGEASIDKMIFVQADCAPSQAVEEAAWAASPENIAGGMAGVVAFAPVEEGMKARASVEKLAEACSILKGIRQLIQAHPEPGYCTQAAFIEGVRLLAEYDLSFDLCFKANQIMDVIELCKMVPKTRLVVDHIGKPDFHTDHFDAWAAGMKKLGAFPHVSCKLSSLATEAIHLDWTSKDLEPYVTTVLEAFGVERCMFGSDWPVSLLAHDFPTGLDLLMEFLDGLSPSEQKMILSENAQRIYRL